MSKELSLLMETYVTKSLSIDVQFHYIYVSSFKLIQLFYKKLTVQEYKNWNGDCQIKIKTKKNFSNKKKPNTQQQIYSKSFTLGKSVNLKKKPNKQGQQASFHNNTDRCRNILGKWHISFCHIVVSLAHIPMNHQPRDVPSAMSFTLV